MFHICRHVFNKIVGYRGQAIYQSLGNRFTDHFRCIHTPNIIFVYNKAKLMGVLFVRDITFISTAWVCRLGHSNHDQTKRWTTYERTCEDGEWVNAE